MVKSLSGFNWKEIDDAKDPYPSFEESGETKFEVKIDNIIVKEYQKLLLDKQRTLTMFVILLIFLAFNNSYFFCAA